MKAGRQRRAALWTRPRVVLAGLLGVAGATGAVAQPRVEPSGAQAARVQGAPVVWLPGAWFTQGSDESGIRHALRLCLPGPDAIMPGGCPEERFAPEHPARRVWVSGFGIDRTEVTRRAWRRCVGAGVCPPSRLPGSDSRVSQPHHPVAGITWAEAQRYCEFVGGRLPTEAEWERAARGRGGNAFPWGDVYNDRLANHGRGGGRPDGVDGYRYAAPVGSFPDGASPAGLLDMAGNVWEWTADRYDPEAYRSGPRVDPHGPEEGNERVVRGGSWQSPAYAVRAAHRERRLQTGAWPDVGFRCAYDAR